MSLIAIPLALFCLCGTLELLMLTLGAILAPKSKITPSSPAQPPQKTAVVIPAYNEEAGISSTLDSLKKCSGIFEIYVIADNCTDRTAAVSRAHGVQVLERHDLQHRGKDFALKFAFDRLLADGYEIFIVIDADSIASPNLINVIQAAFHSNIDALQVFDGVLNAPNNTSLRLMKIAYLASNWIKPLGRNFWGFSCGIFGNGFALSKQTLLDVPFQENALVEDLNYHLSLVKASKYVHFCSQAHVMAEMPVHRQSQALQRVKWEKGRLHSAYVNIPKLLPLILKGQWRLIEPTLDLLTLPLSYHLMLILLLLCFTSIFVKAISIFACLVVMLHVSTAMIIGKAELNDYIALLKAPFYLLWKVALLGKILKKSPQDKNRTLRKNETPHP